MADEGRRVPLAHSSMNLRPWSSAKADKENAPTFRSRVGPEKRIFPDSCCFFIQTKCWSSVTVHSSRGRTDRRCMRYHIDLSPFWAIATFYSAIFSLIVREPHMKPPRADAWGILHFFGGIRRSTLLAYSAEAAASAAKAGRSSSFGGSDRRIHPWAYTPMVFCEGG